MVGPGLPLTGFLRPWPQEVSLEEWQHFSTIKSER